MKIQVKKSKSNGGEFFIYLDGRLAAVIGTIEKAADYVKNLVLEGF